MPLLPERTIETKLFGLILKEIKTEHLKIQLVLIVLLTGLNFIGVGIASEIVLDSKRITSSNQDKSDLPSSRSLSQQSP